MVLSDEEKKERKRLANKKYRESKSGATKTSESLKRYTNTDEYKARRREYMREYMRKYTKKD